MSEQSETLKELASMKSQIKQVASGTPVENDDVEAPQSQEQTEVQPEVTAEAQAETPQAEETPKEEETLIQIGDQVFKSQAEAFKYAQALERKMLEQEAYNQGIRDSLQATQKPVEQPPEPDNFEEEFYANPKEALKKMQEQATQKALATMEAKQRTEALWNQFLTENPDIDRKDAEKVLAENMDTIGMLTDVPKAMKLLAQKTRAEYQRIVERYKPRTELANRQGQVVSSGSQQAPRVTQQPKSSAPSSFISELKNVRKI